VAAAARLRLADPGIVGETVELPDNRHLRPMPVVGRGLPDGEQPSAQLFHHRVVDVAEDLDEPVVSRRSEVDRLVQIQERVAVVALHVHVRSPRTVDSGT
jgi:hypothetical protein